MRPPPEGVATPGMDEKQSSLAAATKPGRSGPAAPFLATGTSSACFACPAWRQDGERCVAFPTGPRELRLACPPQPAEGRPDHVSAPAPKASRNMLITNILPEMCYAPDIDSAREVV